MKELLTERDILVLRAYANFNMRVQPTAEAVHYHRRTIYNIFASIYKHTGLDPTSFWDLVNLIQTVAKEELDGK